MKPLQKILDLPEIIHMPLMPLEGAMSLIRLDSVGVIERCDSGIIPWAFNLSAKTDPRRRDIHILHDSVFAYRANDYKRLEELKQYTLDQVIDAILPKPSIKKVGQKVFRTIRATELSLRFACSTVHIAHLIRRGELTLSGIQVKTPKHSPFVDYDSAVRFLRNREISMEKGTNHENP